MMDLNKSSNELHKAFKLLNEVFFNNELPVPAITIQSSGKRLSMGWCSIREVWENDNRDIRMYELNISAEYLNIEFMETMDTMMHEMVHLFNSVHGVKDTSRNGTYHNKRFKAECEKRGFYFPDERPDKRYGWAFPKLTEETKKKILSLSLDPDAFTIKRIRPEATDDEKEDGEKRGSSRKKSYKWVCPGCTVIVRSTKEEISLMCGKCEQHFILDD